MKRNYFYFALLAAVTLLSAFCNHHKTVSLNTTVKEQKGFALIELFTSEGCSSCPAADKAVEELAKQYPSTVYVLAFHVDYWNRLGWTDEFSQPEYTARQSEYAAKFNLESIYTPQVVVNGRQEFVGSDKAKLQQVTATEAGKEPGAKIELTTELKNGNTYPAEGSIRGNPKLKDWYYMHGITIGIGLNLGKKKGSRMDCPEIVK